MKTKVQKNIQIKNTILFGSINNLYYICIYKTKTSWPTYRKKERKQSLFK